MNTIEFGFDLEMNEIQLINLKRVYLSDYLYHSNCLACRELSYKC